MFRCMLPLLIFCFTCSCFAVELELTTTIGKSEREREKSWKNKIDFIEWIDNQTIIYGGRHSDIICYDLSTKAERWKVKFSGEIKSLTIGKNVCYLLESSGKTHAISLATGENGKSINTEKSGFDYFSPTQIHCLNQQNWLVAASFESKGNAKNVFIFDQTSLKLIEKFKSDGFVTQLSLSRNEKHIVTLSSHNNIRIWSLENKEEIFKIGKDKSAPIDAPFTSNAVFDGNKTLVYTIDDSWATGTVHVHDIHQNKELAKFDSRNGHAVVDVDFTNARIGLSGSKGAVTLLDFTGKEIAELNVPNAIRVLSLKFSPDNKRISIGCWDTTMRIYNIKENTESPIDK
jgi:WD40 repeat protein